jgi:hypothetical protein
VDQGETVFAMVQTIFDGDSGQGDLPFAVKKEKSF